MSNPTDKLKLSLRPPTRKEVYQSEVKKLVSNAVKRALAQAQVQNLIKEFKDGREPS